MSVYSEMTDWQKRRQWRRGTKTPPKLQPSPEMRIEKKRTETEGESYWDKRRNARRGTGRKGKDKGAGSFIDKMKIGGKSFKDLSADDVNQIGDTAVSVLNALDILTGGQDKILPGTGHTYSSSYNPEMYIGRTV